MTISPSKDCWSRYDIDTNFRVLAEWLGPGLPESNDPSWASVAQWRAGISCLWKFRIEVWLTRVNRGGSRPDLAPTPIDWMFSFCSHGHRRCPDVNASQCSKKSEAETTALAEAEVA